MHQHEGVTELDVIWLAFYYPFCIILAAIICHLTYAQLEESVKATLKEQGIPAPDTEDKGSHDLPVDEVTGQKASPWSLEVSIPISLFHTVFQIYLFHQAADHANFIARENVWAKLACGFYMLCWTVGFGGFLYDMFDTVKSPLKLLPSDTRAWRGMKCHEILGKIAVASMVVPWVRHLLA